MGLLRKKKINKIGQLKYLKISRLLIQKKKKKDKPVGLLLDTVSIHTCCLI